MSYPHRFMNGEEDKTEEIINTILRFGIKEEMLTRISGLLILQLYGSFISRSENPFIIVDEISCLGRQSFTGAKAEPNHQQCLTGSLIFGDYGTSTITVLV
ncbi:hypothetical protein G9X20_20275 [Salmonella enterica subsp. enterica serovar Adjame]|nr:hypothetical protein G9X20_20275 [Salmonella enterica subsp. enterica serovar Adjame]